MSKLCEGDSIIWGLCREERGYEERIIFQLGAENLSILRRSLALWVVGIFIPMYFLLYQK